MTNDKLREKIKELTARAGFELPDDVLGLLKKAYAAENNKKAKQALGWILDNAGIARKYKLAICQDTGLPVVFVEASKLSASQIKAIEDGLAAGYQAAYLRPSMVDPLKRDRPSYRGSKIQIDFDPAISGIKISLLPKGFGSENKSQVKMFNPTASLAAIEDFVVEAVKKAGPEACPPFVVGVGIGSTSDGCLLLAKKALLGDLGKNNPDKELRNLEQRLLKKINALNIGPMGLGGKTTALAVKILKAPTHIAGLPVGVNISCHALRKARLIL